MGILLISEPSEHPVLKSALSEQDGPEGPGGPQEKCTALQMGARGGWAKRRNNCDDLPKVST